MHIRVLLSRYRGYLPCTACGGARLMPEALDWRLPEGSGTHDAASSPTEGADAPREPDGLDHPRGLHPLPRPVRRVLRGLPARRTAGRRDLLPARRAQVAASLSRRSRPRVPHPRPPVAHPERRRGPAHQPHHRARDLARQHPVRARRAEHRAPSPRPRPHGRGAAPAARPGEHDPGGGARRPGDPRRGPGARPRAGSGGGRRRHRLRRTAGRAGALRRLPHRGIPERPAPDRGIERRRTGQRRGRG